MDFGGIVKGYCVDLVKNYLLEKGYDDFIINAGGDIFVNKTSCIAIDSPFENDDIFALLDLKNKSLSTSGTYKRNWKIDKKNYHHILNPNNNENNNEIISISLISDKCYLSDCYATSCIAMGISKSIDFLEKQNIDGIIIGKDGKIYKIGNLDKYAFEII
ncbi:MAG: FAD:protein FMN transferase [Candidatus Gracilibacteria bacterium]|nr:FAD:protein FMN transferase [Candidatus Gracilibacteria bacterium]